MIHRNVRTARDFLRIWFFWKRHALVAGAVAALIVIVYAYTATPRYTSSAKVVLLPRTIEGVNATAGLGEQRIAPISIEDVNTELELMKSDDLMRETVRSFLDEGGGLGLSEENGGPLSTVSRPLKKALGAVLLAIGLREEAPPFERMVSSLRNSLHAESKALANVIEVRLTAENPRAAARVLNRYLDVYVKHHNRVFTIKNNAAYFGEQAAAYGRRLDTTEAALNDRRRRHELVDLELQNQKNVERLANLEDDRDENESEIQEIAERMRLLREMLSNGSKDVVITEQMRSIPAIAEFEKALVPLLLKRGEISAKYTVQSRAYMDLERQIEAAYEERTKEVAKSLEADSLKLQNLESRRRYIAGSISDLKDNVVAFNEEFRDADRLERFADMQRNSYLLYASRAQDARNFSESVERLLSNVSVADYADAPVKRSFPKRLPMILLAAVLALWTAAVIPFVLEFADQRLKTAGDVETLLGLRVVCTISEDPSANGKHDSALFLQRFMRKA